MCDRQTMRLRNTGAIDDAVQTLTELKYSCQNAQNATAVTLSRDGYLSWVERAFEQYRSIFVDSVLGDGLYTPAYWRIRDVTQATPRPYPLIHGEIDHQVRCIEEVLQELADYKVFVQHPGTIVVPDTSALVRGELYSDVDWNALVNTRGSVRLVVPIFVVEEIDGIKDRERNSRAGDKARAVLRKLRDTCRTVEPGTPARVRDGVTVEVLLDGDRHDRLPNADAEIIDQALSVQSMVGHQVVFTCVDASMEFRARQRGLRVVEMPTPQDVREKPDPK